MTAFLAHHADWSLTWEEDKKKQMVECDFHSGHFDEHECKKHFKKAYAVTYWLHSWDTKTQNGSDEGDRSSPDEPSADDDTLEDEQRRRL